MANVFRKRAEALTKENPLWEIAAKELSAKAVPVMEAGIVESGGIAGAESLMSVQNAEGRETVRGSLKQERGAPHVIRVVLSHRGHHDRLIAAVLIHGHGSHTNRVAGRSSRTEPRVHPMKGVAGATGLTIMTKVTA